MLGFRKKRCNEDETWLYLRTDVNRLFTLYQGLDARIRMLAKVSGYDFERMEKDTEVLVKRRKKRG